MMRITVSRPSLNVVLGVSAFLTVCFIFKYSDIVADLRWRSSEICLTDSIHLDSSVRQDDPCLLKLIRNKFLYPPSTRKIYLQHPEVENPSMGQSQKVLEYLSNKKKGFFIECGALDGETRSNTLFMEQNLDWNGVLIEGDPDNFQKMKAKNRKAWMVSGCLSPVPYPKSVLFHKSFNLGRISAKDSVDDADSNEVQVQCFPLYSILLALNRTQVDYFSLDVEGDELAVLKTIPWDRVDIQTLSVEYFHDEEGKEEIKNFMEGKGYKVIAEVNHPNNWANDFIFVKTE